jgi:hypothetical protein
MIELQGLCARSYGGRALANSLGGFKVSAGAIELIGSGR